ncbi:MAG: hypothetical protein GXY52_08040 [Chloroflexi bacterium]|nr:hypothetical protein [Chloroflexota bacterium]
MPRCVVVYRSMYGYTRRYAELIAQALDAQLLEGSRCQPSEVAGCNLLIYLGGVYANRINGWRAFYDRCAPRGARIILGAVGYLAGTEADMQRLWSTNLKPGEELPRFYMRGGFDYNRLRLGHKLIMRTMFCVLKGNKNLDAEMRSLLDSYDVPADYVTLENTAELITAARGLLNPGS